VSKKTRNVAHALLRAVSKLISTPLRSQTKRRQECRRGTLKRAPQILFLLACAARAERFEAAEPHMGTVVRITIYADNDSSLKPAFARIAELDQKLSDYKPDSELNIICRSAHDRPVRVSTDLYRVLESAQKLSARSDGAFDVSIGPVTHLWRQGNLAGPAALARVGWRSVILSHGMVYLKLAAMQLDLGAIAKGYAADEALAVLRAHGVKRALVAVSGDIAAGDPPPGKKGWTIKVEPGDREVHVQNAAISTSGDTEQFVEIGGVRYSHIIDPKTGLGLTNHIAVTVIAKRGLDADPLATALSVMGEQRGLAMLRKYYPRARAFFTTSQALDRGSINSK
jgi:thiamine biosynthesis lipoprotein